MVESAPEIFRKMSADYLGVSGMIDAAWAGHARRKGDRRVTEKFDDSRVVEMVYANMLRTVRLEDIVVEELSDNSAMMRVADGGERQGGIERCLSDTGRRMVRGKC